MRPSLMPILAALALGLPHAAAAQTTGTLTGTITAAADGAPIAGATVTVYDPLRTGVGAMTATTNASGAYSISTVPAGSYSLRVSAPGFAGKLYDDMPCAAVDCVGDGFSPGTAGTPVIVTAGATTTVNVALDRGGTIGGTARRSPNDYIAPDVTVRLYNASTSLVASSTTSLLDGTYAFNNVPFGTYFARTVTKRTPLVKPDWVDEVYGGPVCPAASTLTCRVDLGTPIVISPAAPAATVDFALDFGGEILGAVKVNGQFPPFGTPSEMSGGKAAIYVGDVEIDSFPVDPIGGFAFGGLAPGAYRVRTIAPTTSGIVDRWYGDVCISCGPGKPIIVEAGAITRNADINVDKVAGGMSGTLTLERLPFTGMVATPEIQVFNAEGVLVKSAAPGPTGSNFVPSPTAAGGSVPWTIGGLPPGTYYVRTSSVTRGAVSTPHPDPGAIISGFWVNRLYGNGVCVAADCLPTRGAPVVVTAGQTTAGIDIALEFGGTLTGQHPLGTFLGTVRAEIYDARGVALPGRIGANFAGGTTLLAAGLPAGVYYLLLRRDDRGKFPDTLYRDIVCDGCSVTSGTPVAVALGEQKTGIDFTALPAQAIRGTVRSNTTALLSTITVKVFAANGALAGSATATADGVYIVPGLNPGQYYARTANQRGYTDVLYDNLTCGGCDPTRGTPIVIAPGADTAGIDFTLAPGIQVSGVVKTAGDSAPPLNGVSVSLYTASGTQVARVATDVAGRYEATLPGGTYRAATEPYAGYNQKLYDDILCPRGICNVAAGTDVTVAATPVGNIDFRLASCGGGTIAPPALASAAVGVAYRQALSAFGGAGGSNPRFTITSGALPPGLSLDAATGVMSGTPSAPGAYTFTVAAADDIGCAAARTYVLDVPSCTFNVPAQIVASAAGEGRLLEQTCTDPWTTSADVAWIKATRASSSQSRPDGAFVVTPQLVVTIDPNASAASRRGNVTVGSRVIAVLQAGTTTTPPFGVLEIPANGAIVSGSVAIGGWALDDIAVSRVAIYRDPVAGEGSAQIYVGDATMVPGARPDVEAAFPAIATKARAGWGYLLLTNVLPGGGNGTFRLYAYADDMDGHRVLLGTRTIVAANSSATRPFGAIDTPAQGGTVAGSSYINWGWALTRQPKLIPFDGSTIDVFIDGVPVGKLTSYNLFRSDVSGAFPGLKNSGGPVGYRAIDTTALSEGMHTIAWVVIDDGGEATGIGSRFFTVQNSAWLPSLRSAVPVPPAFSPSEIALADRTTAVPPRIDGIDLGRRSASLASLPVFNQADAVRTVDLKPLQGLELALSGEESTCAPGYEGYLVVNGELRALPIGSSLDPKGTFYWQPGPGFLGAYRFVFVRTTCDGARTRIPLTVTIR